MGNISLVVVNISYRGQVFIFHISVFYLLLSEGYVEYEDLTPRGKAGPALEGRPLYGYIE